MTGDPLSDHTSHPTRTWRLRPRPAAALELARTLNISSRLAAMLINRGISSAAKARSFLSPTLHQLPDPFLLPDMERAVQRLLTAFQRREKLFVFGDYDMDGISATALLVDYLRRTGFSVDYSIPERLVDGYGLNRKAIGKAIAAGANLALTVDCGIANHEEIAFGKKQGLDFIVTDHHQIPAELPKSAIAVIDPHLPASTYPDRDLAGVGVAFNLIMALRRRLREAGLGKEINLLRYLDLVALGTVADVVSMSGTNRIFTRFGLREIKRQQRLGLRALLQVCQIHREHELSSRDLAFRIAPKVNAVGRIASAVSAVELFLTDDRARAWQLANYLKECNHRRLELEQQIRQEVEELMAHRPELATDRVILLASDRWHPGVVGIVASRVAENSGKPVLLLARKGDIARGSGRSRPGVNLVQALEHCRRWLLRFGGHSQAVGLTLPVGNIDHLRSCLNDYLEKIQPLSPAPDELLLEDFLSVDEITSELWRELELLQPFGPGNPQPIFGLSNIRLESFQLLGRREATRGARHYRFVISCPTGHRLHVPGVAFNYEGTPPKTGDQLDLAFTLEENHWRGRRELRLKLVAFRPAGDGGT